jgi:hypothetical protein
MSGLRKSRGAGLVYMVELARLASFAAVLVSMTLFIRGATEP